jgi:hypothetical protein
MAWLEFQLRDEVRAMPFDHDALGRRAMMGCAGSNSNDAAGDTTGR